VLEVGSPLDHASTINRGGLSRMRITDVMRENLAKLMKRARGALRRMKVGRNLRERYAFGKMYRLGLGERFALHKSELHPSELTARKIVQNSAIMKLAFLFNRKKKKAGESPKARRILETKVAQRRFLGLTPEVGRDIRTLVVSKFRGAA
jgi:hypothetical protein